MIDTSVYKSPSVYRLGSDLSSLSHRRELPWQNLMLLLLLAPLYGTNFGVIVDHGAKILTV